MLSQDIGKDIQMRWVYQLRCFQMQEIKSLIERGLKDSQIKTYMEEDTSRFSNSIKHP